LEYDYNNIPQRSIIPNIYRYPKFLKLDEMQCLNDNEPKAYKSNGALVNVCMGRPRKGQ